MDELETVELQPSRGRCRREARLDWTRLRSAFLQLAEGLSALHGAGRVHRDIKPKNVLVTPGTGASSSSTSASSPSSAPGRVDQSSGLHAVGTPAYMSPEQARGSRAREASDWYSVGVMLYEALTGLLPFQGEPVDILARTSSSPKPFRPASGRRTSRTISTGSAASCSGATRRAPFRRRDPPPAPRRGAREPAPGSAAARARGPPLRRAEGDSSPRSTRHSAGRKRGAPSRSSCAGPPGWGRALSCGGSSQELAEREPTCVVLAGRCYERESMPYKALDSLIDALSQYLRALPPHEAEALLPRDVLTLARLFPVLKRVEAVSRARRRGPEIPDSQELRRRAVGALRELLGALSDRVSLVLFIDDLQWGDVDGAALLSSILRPPDPPPLLLIGCKRSEDRGGLRRSSPFLPARASRAKTIRSRTRRRALRGSACARGGRGARAAGSSAAVGT